MQSSRENSKIMIYLVSGFCLLAIVVALIVFKLYIYSSIPLLLLFFDLVLLVIYLNSTKSSEAIYNSELAYILKSFDSNLASLDCDLKLHDKQIVKLENFEDINSCHEEINKPILFSIEDNSTIFVLLDDNTMYYTVLKSNDSVENSIEKEILKVKSSKMEDELLLDDLDRTTIIKTKDNKKFKVSPVRD